MSKLIELPRSGGDTRLSSMLLRHRVFGAMRLYPAAIPSGGVTTVVVVGRHPVAVTAVNARIAATTTFVARRDMATPFIRPPVRTLAGAAHYFNRY